MDPFQKCFAALATGYFDLISRGKARKWASYVTDAIAQKRIGFDLPEYDPNYRFRIHEMKRARKSKTSPRLRKGEKQFTYAQVPLHDGRSIRLVTINPARDETPIVCTLKTVLLEESILGSYEALSYTWGDPTGNSSIIINDMHFFITLNLHDFLIRARSKSDPLTFWIDSICINQADPKERSGQVRLMRDIYANAANVRVWLGEETKSTATTLSLASALALVEPQIARASVLTPEDIENSTRDILGGDHTDWKALDLIYWQPWFSRTWIIQEIALAKKAQVQCGSHEIPWDNLAAAGRVLVNHHLTSALDIDPSPIVAMQVYRDATVNGKELTLLELMQISRSNRSTDPRDKIYGILGIAADIQAHHIDPNYELSVESAYTNLALSCIRVENNLDFLSAVEDYKWRVHKNLPSWVPDWSAHPRSTAFLSQPQRWAFSASGDSSPQTSSPSAPSSLSILRVRGKLIDTIRRVGSADVPMRDNIPGARGSSYFRQTLIQGAVAQRQHWENLVSELETYPTGSETPMEAWHHTAIAEGRLDPPHDDDDDVHRLYAAWKKHWGYLLNYRLSNLPEAATAEELREREHATVYTQAWREAFRFRRFVVTERGYMGLTSYSARPDDKVCLLYGGKTVYVLREKRDGRWRFVCEAYVRGLMQGQGMGEGVGGEREFEIG
ncbi:hypothetical protein MMC10_000631 [Thelotrema lepadinum]|nr:hypothetical protein [Thelotrema lepadinum]